MFFLPFCPFLAFLRAGRRPRGCPDLVGSMLPNYGPELPDGNPVYAIFDDFASFVAEKLMASKRRS